MEQKTAGFFLGLPHMHGPGLTATKAERIPVHLRGKSFIYADDVLLQAPHYAELIKDWLEALAPEGKLILWVTDVRHAEPPAGCARVTLNDLIAACGVKDGLKTVTLKSNLGICIAERDKDAGQLRFVEADVIGGKAFLVVKREHFAVENPAAPWRKQKKHVLVCRTGVHGDALQAASVLPHLKANGWHVTMMVRDRGFEALKHDPHIDEFMQIPDLGLADDELGGFWQAWTPRFDRVINLNQSVEMRFLKMPMHGNYHWPLAQRQMDAAGSYLEFTHRMADVPRPYNAKFYPSDAEKAWAQKSKTGLGKFVFWCLQGGAVHKWWPYAPQAIVRLLGRTDYHFVLSGDRHAEELAYKVTEAVKNFYGDTTRLHSLVNTKTIRAAMALAQQADLVIGPETGVMNAVSMEPMPKIVFLSHSSARNLTDDWKNTSAMVPNVPCYPCHRMHYNHDYCPQDKETGAAVCAASIGVDEVVKAVLGCVENSKNGLVRMASA